MKIVSPNFLAAGCCISLLTVPTIAAKKQQRLRTLEGDTVDSSLSIPSIEAAAMQHMTGSKSAKSEGPGSAKSAKSEWEGVASKSAKSAAGSGTTQDQDVVLSNLDTPGVCNVTSALSAGDPASQINCFTTDGPTTLNSVRFWLGDAPVAGLLVRVYDGTVEGGPDGDRDAFLVEQDFTPNFGGVNTVTLENPLEITGDGFCVGVVGPQFGLQLEGDGVVGDGAGQGYYRTSGSSEFIGIDLKLCIEGMLSSYDLFYPCPFISTLQLLTPKPFSSNFKLWLPSVVTRHQKAVPNLPRVERALLRVPSPNGRVLVIGPRVPSRRMTLPRVPNPSGRAWARYGNVIDTFISGQI